jgi:uncharacterized protein with von Willebrand factor type A (vWA) domain
MSDEQQVAKDPFYDLIPERAGISISNIGVRDEGMVRVVLEINGQEKELYHGYVIDCTVSHWWNLTWLLNRNNKAENAKLVETITRVNDTASEQLDALREENAKLQATCDRYREALEKLECVSSENNWVKKLVSNALTSGNQEPQG